ncbi:MAG: polysaccharide deacetylase family protein, partial [Vicinamibacterales bacterium]
MSGTPRLRLAAFAYHDVADDPSTSGLQRPTAVSYKLPVALFRAHLDAIAASGQPVGQPVTALEPDADASHVVLTFDDGGRSALAVAEELSRRGWAGHFLIVSDRIGTPGFVAPADLRHLVETGHVVGSHSRTHPDVFSAESEARMREEWRASRARIEDITGAPCVVASVPGGDSSPLVVGTAAEAGNRVLFTSVPVVRPQWAGDCLVVGRMSPRQRTPARRIGELASFRGWDRELRQR